MWNRKINRYSTCGIALSRVRSCFRTMPDEQMCDLLNAEFMVAVKKCQLATST
jgi:hypothetical protein